MPRRLRAGTGATFPSSRAAAAPSACAPSICGRARLEATTTRSLAAPSSSSHCAPPSSHASTRAPLTPLSVHKFSFPPSPHTARALAPPRCLPKRNHHTAWPPCAHVLERHVHAYPCCARRPRPSPGRSSSSQTLLVRRICACPPSPPARPRCLPCSGLGGRGRCGSCPRAPTAPDCTIPRACPARAPGPIHPHQTDLPCPTSPPPLLRHPPIPASVLARLWFRELQRLPLPTPARCAIAPRLRYNLPDAPSGTIRNAGSIHRKQDKGEGEGDRILPKTAHLARQCLIDWESKSV